MLVQVEIVSLVKQGTAGWPGPARPGGGWWWWWWGMLGPGGWRWWWGSRQYVYAQSYAH